MLSYMLADAIPGEQIVATFIRQPVVIFIVLYCYYYFVRKCGPAWMATRPAFNLRSTMLAYNAFQVLFNLGLVLYSFHTMHAQGKNCLQCITSDGNTRLNLLLYTLNKYSDLLDTVIFVLRKKQNQVTFLHVHHHCAVIIWTTWTMYYPNYTSGGGTIPIVLNTFVHVLMYSYYFVTIYDPQLRARLSHLKQHLTHVQLFQFVLMITHFSRDVTGYCTESIWGLSLGGLVQNVFFLYLFSVMYVHTYLRKKQPKVAE